MPKVGQILQVTYKDSGSAQLLVLQVEAKAKRMLVALVSQELAGNLSRVRIGEDQFVYPSIQATVWMNLPNLRTHTGENPLAPPLLNLIYVWPALTLDEKRCRVEAVGNDSVSFGEKGQTISAVMSQEIRVLQSLSLRHLRNSKVPPQLTPRLLADNYLSSRTRLPIRVLEESSFAFFAGAALLNPITTHLNLVGTQNDVYRGLLIRKSARFRSKNNQIGSQSDDGLFESAINFMEGAGLDFLQVLAGKEEALVLKAQRSSSRNKNITVRSLDV